MSYTAQKIHEMAIAIIDEISDNGSVDPNKTKEYANRAPRLLDMWQKEMSKSVNPVSIEEYECTNEEDLNKWVKYSIPASLKSINEIIFIDADSQISNIEYKLFGTSDIYLYFLQLGTARMSYIPFLAQITTLTQTLAVDDVTAMSGAYYLAQHYAMADQNDELSVMCSNKYKDLKKEASVGKPYTSEDMIDYYGGG